VSDREGCAGTHRRELRQRAQGRLAAARSAARGRQARQAAALLSWDLRARVGLASLVNRREEPHDRLLGCAAGHGIVVADGSLPTT
jgi:hypothetical protein